jgi:hypothetical protein
MSNSQLAAALLGHWSTAACATAPHGAWAGKVVLCERGVISFYDKVINVQNSGGAAAVIYNNVPGGFLGTLGEGSSPRRLSASA